MRKKLTTYIEEEYIMKLKRLALEQESSVADIINALVRNHLEIDIVCISDFKQYLQTKRIQYKENIFEFDKYEDLDSAVKFYKDEKEVCNIESEFFELEYKENLIELIPINTKDFFCVNNKFIKYIK
ncbi:hypothetical protein [Clostridium paraputrificum]|uniref:hypothetical protein n=1 Tax=Clostridium paraputrificum TaxID=29363 RepID=UPI00189EC213|nr:hypothetical protein [Clostridium paraputrificum]